MGLSVALGVPQVGIALLAGRALAATVFAVGCALVSLSESINPNMDTKIIVALLAPDLQR